MEIRQAQFNGEFEASGLKPLVAIAPHLVWVFGSVGRLTDPQLATQLRAQFGAAQIVGCSTSGKLVMGGRVEEEVEAVKAAFGSNATLAGFYSNGEIGPHGSPALCQLHNQTMTITCLRD